MSDDIFELLFTQKASDDLNQIYSYIAKTLFAEHAAEKLIQEIECSILRLKDHPLSCSVVTIEPLKRKNYRKLIVDKYLVFYIVDEKERQVVIMRILYGAVDYQNIL